MIILRQETPDQPDIAALFKQADVRSASLYGDHERSGVSAAQLIAQDVRFFVARPEISGQAVGCGGYVPMPEITDGVFIASSPVTKPGICLEIKRLFVDPAARRQGIAQKIMRYIEQDARERGYVGIYLETGIKSDAAILLYQALGFARCLPFGPYQNDVQSVFMAKSVH
ncbi:GNAT family N-acetyltransferase [uncultured Thalassospira sp.]|uniref:GNAT family N-acetyltransferase n=1 Tax=uncultured Thalassospira sp. TaxID=404382 RepID=UPI0030DB5825|tara:strand:+ start:668 stop:1177 length:510 start_codon:yes stop_codon:yes gene_type:complete